MNARQVKICKEFGHVVFPPATSTKRFALNMYSLANYNPDKEITDKQAEYIEKLLHRFRRQLKKIHAEECTVCPKEITE